MLIRSEVNRRAENLNQYLKVLKEKVEQQKYREAKELIRSSKESVNNSYMAPYDPNIYLLDSLKTKTEKLMHEKAILEDRVCRVKQRIAQKQLKKGFHPNKNKNVAKASAKQIGIYASRISLTLKDAEKVDYEMVDLETDFKSLKILFGQKTVQIAYEWIVTLENSENEILISWRDPKAQIETYMIFNFEEEELREKWANTIKFCKLIDESKLKKKLFMKHESPSPEMADKLAHNFDASGHYAKRDHLEEHNHNLDIDHLVSNIKKQRKNSSLFPKDSQMISSQKPNNQTTSHIHKIPTYRQSQYSPFAKKIHAAEESFLDQKRKASADLTLLNFKNSHLNDKKIYKYKSHKNFEENRSQSNSQKTLKGKKQKMSQQEDQGIMERSKQKSESEEQKVHQEEEEIQKENKSQVSLNWNHESGISKSNQIFINNDSSIHWIQEEREEEKSISENKERHEILNVFEEEENNGEHISEEEPVEDDSPTIPYNMRKERRETHNLLLIPVRNQEQDNEDMENKSQYDEEDQKSNQPSENNRSEKEKVAEEIRLIGNKQQDHHEQGVQQIHEIIDDNERDHQTQSDNSDKDTEKYELNELEEGVIVLKCSEGGWNPHLKKLYLSPNKISLCWSEPKGETKSISLSDIQLITLGHRGKGIAKHIKSVQPTRCLLIKGKFGKETKFLEFYLQEKYDIENLNSFVERLKRYWEERFSKH